MRPGYLLEEKTHRMARKIIYLDREAARSAEAGDTLRAAACWQQREALREARSALLRELWGLRRAAPAVQAR